jgi:hypothetical protein
VVGKNLNMARNAVVDKYLGRVRIVAEEDQFQIVVGAATARITLSMVISAA